LNLYIPAWHYRARAIVQRTWGWSPVEEMVLLTLDQTPGTIEETASALSIPNQVASSTVARLMQFGLLELRFSPRPVLTTSSNGRDFIRSDRPLPERTEEREIGISLVFEKVGHSTLRNRDVRMIPLFRPPTSGLIIPFPPGEPPETDDTLAERVTEFMAGTLRPGEWLRGVQAISSVIEQKYVVLDLADVRNGILPDGASDELSGALRTYVETGAPPQASALQSPPSPSIEIHFQPEHLIFGATEHLERFEAIVSAATSDVFVLSTFVASQSDELCKESMERIWRALERACERGVRCHLFFGTSLDDGSNNAKAMHELYDRLSSLRQTRGYVLVHRDPVGSHAKFLAADDGHGGAVVLFGSCNWLKSPFAAVEVSAELRDNHSAALGLDLLRAIVVNLSSAAKSVQTLHFMASDLRRDRSKLSIEQNRATAPTVQLTVLYADEHERLLRAAAHDAEERFVCCTNKVGATMVPALFNPAEVAGKRLNDVRIYYSRHAGAIKKRHVQAERERLNGFVDLIGVRKPQLHGKFLAWDRDHVVVSTMNWGSQSGLEDNPLDEIGLYLKGSDLAALLLERLDAALKEEE
jgi:hypothetical protein